MEKNVRPANVLEKAEERAALPAPDSAAALALPEKQEPAAAGTVTVGTKHPGSDTELSPRKRTSRKYSAKSLKKARNSDAAEQAKVVRVNVCPSGPIVISGDGKPSGITVIKRVTPAAPNEGSGGAPSTDASVLKRSKIRRGGKQTAGEGSKAAPLRVSTDKSAVKTDIIGELAAQKPKEASAGEKSAEAPSGDAALSGAVELLKPLLSAERENGISADPVDGAVTAGESVNAVKTDVMCESAVQRTQPTADHALSGDIEKTSGAAVIEKRAEPDPAADDNKTLAAHAVSGAEAADTPLAADAEDRSKINPPDALSAVENIGDIRSASQQSSEPAASPAHDSPSVKTSFKGRLKIGTLRAVDWIKSRAKKPGGGAVKEDKINNKKWIQEQDKKEKKGRTWLKIESFKELTLLRKTIVIISGGFAAAVMAPMFFGLFIIGSLPPFLIGMFFAAAAWLWNIIRDCKSVWGNTAIVLTSVLLLAGVSFMFFVSGKMVRASLEGVPQDDPDMTVIVLGCRVYGDRPGKMLKARLEVAADYLLAHPKAHCVVSGGQGEDEQYAEAVIMRRYLIERGVSGMRIITESESHNTHENIVFSLKKAEEYNCHKKYLIVTDRFHQYRSLSEARALGAECYAANAETVWYLAVQYWFYEMVAITRNWLAAGSIA